MLDILKLFAYCIMVVSGAMLALSDTVNEISGLVGIVLFVVGAMMLVQWATKTIEVKVIGE